MSDPIPDVTSMPCSSDSRRMSNNASPGGSAIGLTNTRPAISGWSTASRQASPPPIDNAATTTRSTRAASRSYAACASPTQSAQRVGIMSSMRVPCPGSVGISTSKPAAANARANPATDIGCPVNPCSTSTPDADSDIGVLRPERLLPPVLGGGRPRRVLVDAVDRAHGRQALPAAGAQLREDDHVDPVIEDGAELGRAVAQARVAVDALRHLDAERRVLPLRISRPLRDPLPPGGGDHGATVPGSLTEADGRGGGTGVVVAEPESRPRRTRRRPTVVVMDEV